jgi:hypothetical protein
VPAARAAALASIAAGFAGAVLAACAGPPPRPRPLHNTAAGEASPRAPTEVRCPQLPQARVEPPAAAVGALAGAVIDERCGLIGGATIIARSKELPGGSAQITDEHGRFVLADLPPGRYVVSAYYLASKLDRGGVDIRAGAVEHVQLSMPPPASASPRITHDLQAQPAP